MGDVFTTKSVAAGIIGADLVLELVQQEARAAIVAYNKFTLKTAPRGHNAIRFPKVAGTALSAAVIAEGSAADAQAATFTGVTITPTVVGLDVLATKLAEYTSLVNMPIEVRNAMARAIADKKDADVLALSAGFSQSVGTTGVSAKIADVQQAQYLLTVANAPRGNFGETGDDLPGIYDDVIGFLHPIQVNQLVAQALASGQSWLVSDKATEVLYRDGTKPRGYKGRLLGMPIFESTNVPTADAGVNRLGMFAVPSAIGVGQFWDLDVATDMALASRSTRFGADSAYGVAELVDLYGVGFKSIAT
jgi:hypothetical protein